MPRQHDGCDAGGEPGEDVVDDARRGWLRGALAASLVLPAAAARAMMAGRAPDTPAARVDPNVPGSPWSGVVAVVVGGAAYSGVAIAPLYVLTAAHVAGAQAPAGVQVVVNLNATPVTLGVAAVITYPGTVFPYDDLCLLRLAQPLPAGTATYAIVDTSVPTGTALTLVGYGASGNGDSGVTVAGNATTRRRGRNMLDQYTDRLDASGRTSPFWLYDFDGPSGTGPMGGATLGNGVETCVAGGDSGSPAFLDTGPGPALFGLSTVALNLGGPTASSVFGNGGGGLVLSHPPYLDWLRTQTGHAVLLQSQTLSADVPVAPPWALGALAAALAWPLARRLRG